MSVRAGGWETPDTVPDLVSARNSMRRVRLNPAIGYGLPAVVEQRFSGTMPTTVGSVYTCPAGAVAVTYISIYSTATSGSVSLYAGTSAVAFGSASSTEYARRTMSVAAGFLTIGVPLAAADQLWLVGPAATTYLLSVWESTTAVADGIKVAKVANAAQTTVSLYSPTVGTSARSVVLSNGSAIPAWPVVAAGASGQTVTPLFVNAGAGAVQIGAAQAVAGLTANNPGQAAVLPFLPILTSSTDAIQYTTSAAGVNLWGLFQEF